MIKKIFFAEQFQCFYLQLKQYQVTILITKS